LYTKGWDAPEKRGASIMIAKGRQLFRKILGAGVGGAKLAGKRTFLFASLVVR